MEEIKAQDVGGGAGSADRVPVTTGKSRSPSGRSSSSPSAVSTLSHIVPYKCRRMLYMRYHFH